MLSALPSAGAANVLRQRAAAVSVSPFICRSKPPNPMLGSISQAPSFCCTPSAHAAAAGQPIGAALRRCAEQRQRPVHAFLLVHQPKLRLGEHHALPPLAIRRELCRAVGGIAAARRPGLPVDRSGRHPGAPMPAATAGMSIACQPLRPVPAVKPGEPPPAPSLS